MFNPATKALWKVSLPYDKDFKRLRKRLMKEKTQIKLSKTALNLKEEKELKVKGKQW